MVICLTFVVFFFFFFFFEIELGYFINLKLEYNRGPRRGRNIENKYILNIWPYPLKEPSRSLGALNLSTVEIF